MAKVHIIDHEEECDQKMLPWLLSFVNKELEQKVSACFIFFHQSLLKNLYSIKTNGLGNTLKPFGLSCYLVLLFLG